MSRDVATSLTASGRLHYDQQTTEHSEQKGEMQTKWSGWNAEIKKGMKSNILFLCYYDRWLCNQSTARALFNICLWTRTEEGKILTVWDNEIEFFMMLVSVVVTHENGDKWKINKKRGCW
jgi:hypothetical protein